ncbi:Fe-S cluster assembly scaffold SufA [Roseibium sp.]|uniref:Fe-S cluster assembly scaffold SufA n=1 Tax=Roseibium sp. TaxID=1936156 RepID=UPI003A969D84
MAAASKFQVMTMTDTAAERVRELVDNADGEAQGLRVGIKKGGCAGMEYTMELVKEASPGDDTVEEKGAKLFVDPSAVLFLLGTEMDFEVTKFRSGFVFKNPNEVSACGCGESVSLQEADPAFMIGQGR